MRYAVMSTPLGPMTLASSAKGLALLSFGTAVPHGGILDDDANRTVMQQLEEYFRGERTQFDLCLDLQGTDFQMSVWLELQQIPYGQLRSYGEIAKNLGKPGAARAVGMANHGNPVAVVVPCHRVVGRNGALTGYAAGLHLKQELLAIEQQFRGQ